MNKDLKNYIRGLNEYNYLDSYTGEIITIKENPAIEVK